MRSLLKRLHPALPDNFGLAYDVYGPDENTPNEGGPNYEKRRDDWLQDCTAIGVCDDYAAFFAVWKQGFDQDADAWTKVATLRSRLLIGHGNPSSSEVGLTVHRAWGVPMIPGSALKGLTASYADIVYGREADEGEEREHWRGVVREGRRFIRAPGKYHAALFGAPRGDPRREWEALGICDEVALGPGPAAIGRVGAGLLAPFLPEQTRCPRRHGSNQWPRSTQAVEQNTMQPVPNPGSPPIAQSPPAQPARRRPGSSPNRTHLLRQHFPGNAALKHKQDAAQRRPVWQWRPAALRSRSLRGQQRLNRSGSITPINRQI